MISTMKSAAALAELAADVVQAIASGRQPTEYTLAMIQKRAAETCGCDPNDGYADAIAQIEADEEAEAEREHYEWKREQRLSWGGMVGIQ